ncbi:MAG: hypothetical protein ACYC64_16140 [Armatimonadota bacterium]
MASTTMGVWGTFDDTPLMGFLIPLCIFLLITGFGYLIRLIAANLSFGTKRYSKMNPDDIVIVARYTYADDAYRCQAILKHAGIRCMVEKPVVSLYHIRRGLDLNPMNRVEVSAGDAERAIEVLSRENANV